MRKLVLSLSFKDFKATLVEFAQFGNIISTMLRLKAWVHTSDCIDLKNWHRPFKHKENRRGASFFMQILSSLLNIIDLACKPKNIKDSRRNKKQKIFKLRTSS